MTGRVQTLRSNVAGNRPTGRAPGELYVNWADAQIGSITGGGSPQDLVGVRFFSTTAAYVVGDFVIQGGQLYRAVAPSTPSAFNPVNWAQIGGSITTGDSPPSVPQPGTLWWDSVGGQLYIWYVDVNSSQWVVASNVGAVMASTYLPLTGGTLTGPLTLAADPTVPLGAATKQMIDNIVAQGAFSHENRIINGDMRIDQRNQSASGTASSPAYPADHWRYGNNSGAARGTWQRQSGGSFPGISGFNNWLNFASSGAYTPVASDGIYFYQPIEADLITDFAFGASSAQPATLSFWAYSTLAGTFGGAINNANGTRSYPFTYTLPASVWTKVVVNIPGDTGGTWTLAGNAAGMFVLFDLGSGATLRAPAGAWVTGNYVGANGGVNVVGTNGAQFAFSGVKLEIGNVATPFNRQSLTKSLADCQRYFCTSYAGVAVGTASQLTGMLQYFLVTGGAQTLGNCEIAFQFPVSMRAAPALTFYSPQTGASGVSRDFGGTAADVALPGQNAPGLCTATVVMSPSITTRQTLNLGVHYAANAEL